MTHDSTAPVNEDLPTYDDLKRRGRGGGHQRGGFTQQMRDLPPGGLLEFPLNGRTAQQAGSSLSPTLNRLNKEQPGLARRSRDGRLYVVRLLPEDMP